MEKETSLKKTDIKRLHKIIQEIPSPMNLENTILYVKREAELVKLRIGQRGFGDDSHVINGSVKILIFTSQVVPNFVPSIESCEDLELFELLIKPNNF